MKGDAAVRQKGQAARHEAGKPARPKAPSPTSAPPGAPAAGAHGDQPAAPAQAAQGTQAALGHIPGWLRDLREQAAAVPLTAKGDAWEHTDLAAVLADGLPNPERPATDPANAVEAPARTGPVTVGAQDIAPFVFAGEGARLVFVDGEPVAGLGAGELPRGADLMPLSAVWHDADVEANFGRHADPDHPGVAFNTRRATQGAVLLLRRGVQVPQTIHVLHVHTGAHADRALHAMRHLVLADERSDAQVVFTQASLGSGPATWSTVTEVIAAPSSRVRLRRIQRTGLGDHHVESLWARVQRDAKVEDLHLSVGGRSERNEVHAHLVGQGAECRCDGLLLGTGEQRLDTLTNIEHRAPHTTSRQTYKAVLDGAARGAFLGVVLVAPDAQKTSASQTNRNLLLSDKARAHSTPQLEIHADDVQCSHGSTIGQLSKDALFFLRSRGLGAEHARLLLTQAFAREVLEPLGQSPMRNCVEGLVTSWFAGRHDVDGHVRPEAAAPAPPPAAPEAR